MQYGIRLALEDLALGEFLRLLAGIMPDTPLGRLVSIRSETNQEVIKTFGPVERKIRRDWNKGAVSDVADATGNLQRLQNDLAMVFG